MLISRWNNAKLKELAEEEDTTAHRQRSSRLAKWREIAEQAAKSHEVEVQLPDSIETLRHAQARGVPFWLNCSAYRPFLLISFVCKAV